MNVQKLTDECKNVRHIQFNVSLANTRHFIISSHTDTDKLPQFHVSNNKPR